MQNTCICTSVKKIKYRYIRIWASEKKKKISLTEKCPKYTDGLRKIVGPKK